MKTFIKTFVALAATAGMSFMVVAPAQAAWNDASSGGRLTTQDKSVLIKMVQNKYPSTAGAPELCYIISKSPVDRSRYVVNFHGASLEAGSDPACDTWKAIAQKGIHEAVKVNKYNKKDELVSRTWKLLKVEKYKY